MNEVQTVEQKNEVGFSLEGDLPSHLKVQGEKLGAGAAIDEGIFNADIIIPKIRLQQRSAQNFLEVPAGKFLNSVTGESLGEALAFVVIDSWKIWQKFAVNPNGQDEYISSELFTTKNYNLPYEGKLEDGRDFKRRQGLYYAVLLMDDLKVGNTQVYNLDFFATSKPAGKELITGLDKLNKSGAESFSVVFALGNKFETFSNGNSAFVKKVKPMSYLPAEYIGESRKLVLILEQTRKMEELSLMNLMLLNMIQA